jgi:hypothetical protein
MMPSRVIEQHLPIHDDDPERRICGCGYDSIDPAQWHEIPWSGRHVIDMIFRDAKEGGGL